MLRSWKYTRHKIFCTKKCVILLFCLFVCLIWFGLIRKAFKSVSICIRFIFPINFRIQRMFCKIIAIFYATTSEMVLIKFLVIWIKWMECAFYCFCSVLFNFISLFFLCFIFRRSVFPDCFLFDFVVCTLMPQAITRFQPPERETGRHALSICIMEWFLKFHKHIRCVMWRIFGPLFIYLFRLFSLSFVGIAWWGWMEAFPLFGIHFQWYSNVCTRQPHKPRVLYVN